MRAGREEIGGRLSLFLDSCFRAAAAPVKETTVGIQVEHLLAIFSNSPCFVCIYDQRVAD